MRHHRKPSSPSISLQDLDISSNQHALAFPSFMGLGNRSHSVPSLAPSVSSQPRSMVPENDIALYGYGSVAWKERMEEWKKTQGDNLQVANHQGSSSGWDLDGELDTFDLPIYFPSRCLLIVECVLVNNATNFWFCTTHDEENF
ncbi:Cellulose synthase A catalytic subunit 6 [UDP-forming] [Camellia lanceoleosa]|nr:Cellulose synthase A catalytic subunit 6 [UDP-forming] [Camellia lanceoleosa]